MTISKCLLAIGFSVLLTTQTAFAVSEIIVHVLSNNFAILIIDGERRVIRKGKISPEGVKLVSASSASAVVEVDGLQQILKPDVITGKVGTDSPPIPSSIGSNVLWASNDGFFYANVGVNGIPTRFLVDTGANTIAINKKTAQRLKLDLSRGVPGKATTASGVTPFVAVTLDELTLGNITIRNLRVAVMPGEYPQVPLLGGSFLNQVDMQRTGNRMELTPRY